MMAEQQDDIFQHAAVSLDDFGRGDIGVVAGHEDTPQADVLRLCQSQTQNGFAEALTTAGWANLVADVPAILQETAGEIVAQRQPSSKLIFVDEPVNRLA